MQAKRRELRPEVCLSAQQENGLTDGVDMASWEEQAFLSHGALLAKSCQAAMELAKHDKESQRLAYKYGKHLSLGHMVSPTHHCINTSDWHLLASYVGCEDV